LQSSQLSGFVGEFPAYFTEHTESVLAQIGG
jgi:hypothetical protein